MLLSMNFSKPNTVRMNNQYFLTTYFQRFFYFKRGKSEKDHHTYIGGVLMKFAVITDIHGNAVAVDIIEVAYDDRPCLEAINAAPTPEKELLRKLFLGGRT